MSLKLNNYVTDIECFLGHDNFKSDRPEITLVCFLKTLILRFIKRQRRKYES